ncbi:MAG: ankyrin repeat domain-containing protein [Chlamydiae bacterium]|nr:ankyrin repeat domain-containing protein [Chlamydiota bacterium]
MSISTVLNRCVSLGFRSFAPVSFLAGRSVRWCSKEPKSIFEALDACDLKVLKVYLDKHPEQVVAEACDRVTPLHYLSGSDPYRGIRLPVTQEPPKEFVKLLLAKGASKYALDLYKRTPLDIAASVGYPGIAEELLKKKAILNADTLALALLRSINFDPYFRIEKVLIKALIEAGIDLKSSELLAKLLESIHCKVNSANPLFSDVRRMEDHHFRVFDRKIEFLFQNGADADKMVDGKTALQTCLGNLDTKWTGRVQDKVLRSIALILVAHTKDLAVCDNNGWTLLHWAVFTGHGELTAELIKRGLSYNCPDKQGITPIDLSYLGLDQAILKEVGIDLSKDDLMHPQDIVKIMQKLPLELKPFQRYYEKRPPLTNYTTHRVFATSLFGSCRIFDERLAGEVTSLYKVNMGITGMAEALSARDLPKVLALIQGGWNVFIENEFADFHMLKEDKPVVRFYETWSVLCKKSEDRLFAKEVLQVLNATPSSGVTFGSELESAVHLSDEEKIYLIFEAGFKPETFKSSTGLDFETYLREWYSHHWSDERGLYQSEFFPEMCRIVRVVIEKGWVSKDGWDYLKYVSSASSPT